jgi:hypothetical protein
MVGVAVGVGVDVGVGVAKYMFNDVGHDPTEVTVITEALLSTFTLYPAKS